MEIELKVVLSLVGLFAGLLTTILTAWITVKVNMATITERMRNIEKDVSDHNEWKEKLGDALNNLSIVLGKVEVRLETMNDDIKALKEKGEH